MVSPLILTRGARVGPSNCSCFFGEGSVDSGLAGRMGKGNRKGSRAEMLRAQREERLTGTVHPTRVGVSDVLGVGGLVGTPRPTLVRGFPTWGKQKKKGASRAAPATMGSHVVGRDERPRSSASD